MEQTQSVKIKTRFFYSTVATCLLSIVALIVVANILLSTNFEHIDVIITIGIMWFFFLIFSTISCIVLLKKLPVKRKILIWVLVVDVLIWFCYAYTAIVLIAAMLLIGATKVIFGGPNGDFMNPW